MTPSEVRASLDTFLDQNYSATEIGWDNVEVATSDEYITAQVNIFTAENKLIGAALGNSYVGHKGIYLIDVLVPLQVGTGRAYVLADLLYQLFLNKYISGVFTTVPTVNRSGNNGAGYFVMNVLIPFETDNTGS